jgi:DUF3025 family protein
MLLDQLATTSILSAVNWDPGFLARSPMLAPLVPHAGELSRCCEWPARDMLQEMIALRGVSNQRGKPIRLIAVSDSAGSYEECVDRRGELQVREGNWHDLFNVLTWLAYPRAKAALNARHVSALAQESAGRETGAYARHNRGRARDALTLFDESGAIVLSSDPELVAELRAFRWKHLFWGARRRVVTKMSFLVFGHSLFAKALAPYVGMTAHAIPFVTRAGDVHESLEAQTARVDRLVAEYLTCRPGLNTPHALAPLPLLGVPGWWPGNDDESFYENARYFRSARSRAR